MAREIRNRHDIAEAAREQFGGVSLPADLVPVIDALADLQAAEAAEQEAYEAKQAAETRLAEVVGVRRRDKDTGFEAEFEARRMIVEAAIAAAARGLVFGAATNRSRPHLLARVDAIDALRRLGHSVDQVLRARARALDGASAEEIVALLTEPAGEREALPV